MLAVPQMPSARADRPAGMGSYEVFLYGDNRVVTSTGGNRKRQWA